MLGKTTRRNPLRRQHILTSRIMDISEINGYGDYMDYRVHFDGMDSDLSPCSRDSRDTTSSASPPTSVTLSPRTYHDLEMLADPAAGLLVDRFPAMFPAGEPALRVAVEPAETFRFRYRSEVNGVHGAITGGGRSRAQRTFPTVEVLNWAGPARVRCSLYTAQADLGSRAPSCHQLVVKGNAANVDGTHSVYVNCDGAANLACFAGMSIIHTAKKDKLSELRSKMLQRALEEKRRADGPTATLGLREKSTIEEAAKEQAADASLNNTVSLFFECFDPDGRPICDPVFSGTISNLKSAMTNELKIVRVDKHCSSCLGKEEIFMLVEKVNKKHIQVRFFEMDAEEEEVEIWSDNGTFSELDVHHQYAIVFKTPPYRRLDIETSVDVFMELCRPTDGARSTPVPFQYKPSDKRTSRQRKVARRDSTPASPTPAASDAVDPMLSNGAGGNGSQPLTATTTTTTYLSNTQSIEEVFNVPLLDDIDLADVVQMTGFSWIGDLGDDLATDSPTVVKTEPESSEESDDEVAAARRSELDGRDDGDDGDELSAGQLLLKVYRGCVELGERRRDVTADISESVRRLCSLRTRDGNTAVHLALEAEDPAVLTSMLAAIVAGRCADVLDATNDRGQTALALAVCLDRPALAAALLEAGASIVACAGAGRSAVHLAVELSHDGCLRRMLATQATRLHLDQPDQAGLTALHLAVVHGNLSAVRELLACGADVRARDRRGRTALHFAAEELQVEIAVTLVSAGADVFAVDGGGNTAADVARAKQCRQLMDVLTGIQGTVQNAADDSSSEDEDDFEDAESNRSSSEDEDLSASLRNASLRPGSGGAGICALVGSGRLCSWLDQRDAGRWQALARALGFGFLVNGIDAGAGRSPATALLNYADLNGVDFVKLRAALMKLDDATEALAVVDSFSP